MQAEFRLDELWSAKNGVFRFSIINQVGSKLFFLSLGNGLSSFEKP